MPIENPTLLFGQVLLHMNFPTKWRGLYLSLPSAVPVTNISNLEYCSIYNICIYAYIYCIMMFVVIKAIFGPTSPPICAMDLDFLSTM